MPISHLHLDAPRLDAYVYLIASPSSILLVATENASALKQVFIIALVVGINGVFYGTVAIIFRSLRLTDGTAER